MPQQIDSLVAMPPITLSASDHARLTNLALAHEELPGVGDYLQGELSRANIAPDGAVSRDVVAMHSELEYRDDLTGVTRRVTLVYPGEQDVAAWKISVLTPIGAALIGLSAGQSIVWHDLKGEERRLTVTKVF